MQLKRCKAYYCSIRNKPCESKTEVVSFSFCFYRETDEQYLCVPRLTLAFVSVCFQYDFKTSSLALIYNDTIWPMLWPVVRTVNTSLVFELDVAFLVQNGGSHQRFRNDVRVAVGRWPPVFQVTTP